MDEQLLSLLNRAYVHPALDALMIALTTAGLGAMPAIVALLWLRGMRRAARVLLAAQAASLLLTLIFYFLALRARPAEVRLILSQPLLPSFPSGHAAIAFATATALTLLCRQRAVAAAAFGLAALVAYSRLYLGHHYPSDVMAGALLGALTAAGVYGVVWRREAYWLIWPQIAVAATVTQMAYWGLLPLHLLAWPFADKALHFLLFGAIAFWLNFGLRRRTIVVAGIRLPLAIAIPFAAAASEEMLQLLSPLRSADLSDLISDLAGMVFFYWLSRRWMERPSPPPIVPAEEPQPSARGDNHIRM